MNRSGSFEKLIADLVPYKRILIVGASGVGKSFLARQIAQRLQIPLYNLDKIFWQKNWQQLDKEEFIRRVDEILNTPSFIIEGTYSSTFKNRVARSDLVLLVEAGFFTRFYRIITRSIQNVGRVREDMAEGCVETISWSYFKFLKWALTFEKTKRQLMQETQAAGKPLRIYKNN